MPGPPRATPTGLRPPMQGTFQNDGTMPFNQQKTGVPSMENHMNQFSNGEPNLLDSKSQQTEDMERVYISLILFCLYTSYSKTFCALKDMFLIHLPSMQ